MTDITAAPSAAAADHDGHTKRAGRFPAWADTIFESVLAFILFSELFILFGNILLREIFHRSLPWAEEVASLALVSTAFIGGAIAFYEGEHLSVRFIIDKLPPKWRTFIDAFVNWLIMALAAICLVLIIPVLKANWQLLTPALEISKAWIYAPYPVAMCLLIIFALKRIISHAPRTALAACAAAAGLLCAWYLAQSLTGPWNGLGGFLFGGATLLGAIALGVPIGFALPMVAGLFLFSSDLASIDALPMTMSNGVTGFIMLAIPFFVLAGDVMTEGGLTRPLADWVCSLVGHLCGGLAQVLVVSMFIFSGISGSKVADIAAVGTTMRNMLKEQGYDPAESSAILAGSAIMGETIPPSLPLLVIGSITTISVGALFVAGIVPAVLMAMCLMIFIYFKGRKNSWPKGSKANWVERLKVTIRAVPVLFVPFMLVVGIVGGIATPTEVSSFAVVYAVIIALVFYRSVRVRDLVRIFARSAVIAGMILFTISAGAAFSWTMTVAGLPRLVVELLSMLGGSVTVFLIISLVALVILGGVLEGLPALLVTVPLLMPIAIQSGLNPIHYAIVLIFAMGMGCFVPPFGIGFYVSCSIGESSTEKVTPRLIPYILVLAAGLILVTFVPWFSLVLPKTIGLIH
jgi:tripartite ATP-independent transporter DctM subunit